MGKKVKDSSDFWFYQLLLVFVIIAELANLLRSATEIYPEPDD